MRRGVHDPLDEVGEVGGVEHGDGAGSRCGAAEAGGVVARGVSAGGNGEAVDDSWRAVQ